MVYGVLQSTWYLCTLKCLLTTLIQIQLHLTTIQIAWHKCRCHIARWKVGKCWEEGYRAGAALSCAVARLPSARFSGGWSGCCCCCCSPGLAMARLLLDFSHPASTLSTLQLDLTAVNPGILIGTRVWQGRKKLVKLHFLSSWFWSDTLRDLRECCTLVLGQHWFCPWHSFKNRALNQVVYNTALAWP